MKFINGLLKHETIALTIFLLVSLATLLVPRIITHQKVETSRPTYRAYNLILTQEKNGQSDWVKAMRTNKKIKYVISGYVGETPASLLERLPWLLQPGVDTIFYDPDLAGEAVVDSLARRLELSSPVTVLEVLSPKVISLPADIQLD